MEHTVLQSRRRLYTNPNSRRTEGDGGRHHLDLARGELLLHLLLHRAVEVCVEGEGGDACRVVGSIGFWLLLGVFEFGRDAKRQQSHKPTRTITAPSHPPTPARQLPRHRLAVRLLPAVHQRAPPHAALPGAALAPTGRRRSGRRSAALRGLEEGVHRHGAGRGHGRLAAGRGLRRLDPRRGRVGARAQLLLQDVREGFEGVGERRLELHRVSDVGAVEARAESAGRVVGDLGGWGVGRRRGGRDGSEGSASSSWAQPYPKQTYLQLLPDVLLHLGRGRGRQCQRGDGWKRVTEAAQGSVAGAEVVACSHVNLMVLVGRGNKLEIPCRLD